MMRKKNYHALLLFVGFAISNVSLAQVSMELEQACRGDIELTEFVVELANSNGAATSEFFSNEEKEQINVILNDDAIAAQSLSDRLEAVMVACSEAKILQVKNSYIIHR